jgi:hypothetical protein
MWLCGENMTWSYRQCSNKAVGRIFQGVHVGSTLDVAELVLAQRHLMLRAFSTTGFSRLTQVNLPPVIDWHIPVSCF